jgi:hypothetical protein
MPEEVGAWVLSLAWGHILAERVMLQEEQVVGQTDRTLDLMAYRVDHLVRVVRLNTKVHVMEVPKLILVDFELRIHMLDLLDDILDMGLG